MLKQFRLLFLALSLLSAGVSTAAEIRGLFEARVPVANQGGPERISAFVAALEQVLVKVSGTGSINQNGSLSPSGAARYVQQYRYQSVESDGEQQLELWVRFDEAGIKELLHEWGQPVWGTARPITLIWLAIEQDGQRMLVGANDAGLAREVLRKAGERRGLPVRLPLLDLSDQQKVVPADIWGDFHQPIIEVSERYAPQAILVGRMFPDRGDRWQVRWSLYSGPQTFRWDKDGTDVEALIASGIDGAADWLSRSFTQMQAGDAGSVILNVTGVESVAGYHRVLDYLKGIEGIAAVNLLRVDAQMASFELQANAGAEGIAKVLELGDTMVPVPWELDEGGQTGQGFRGGLLYRLVP